MKSGINLLICISIVCSSPLLTGSNCTSLAGMSSEDINSQGLLIELVEGKGVSCFGGSDGSAIVTVTGNVGMVDYLWSNGSVVDRIENVSAGIYTVTATDESGCSDSQEIQILEPDRLFINEFTVEATECNDGIIEIEFGGGTSGYHVLWSNGLTNDTTISGTDTIISFPIFLDSLKAGTYAVTLTDRDGCIAEEEIIVPSLDITPPTLDCSNSFVDTDQCGGVIYELPVISDNCDTPGQLTLLEGQVSGSLFPSGTTQVTYQVTDAGGNIATCSFTVTVNVDFVVEIETMDTPCGASEGEINIITSGGMPPYFYSPSGPVITDLSEGSYTIIVNDSEGCIHTQNVVIAEINSIETTFFSEPACEDQDDGSLTININGGFPPYDVAIDGLLIGTIDSTVTIPNLEDGSYTVEIIGSGGCTAVASADVAQVIHPDIVFPELEVDCDMDFILTSEIITGISQTFPDATIQGLPDTLYEGSYPLEIDFLGIQCISLDTINVIGSSSLIILDVIVEPDCMGLANVELVVDGGCPPYTFNFESPLEPEEYSLVVMDDDGNAASIVVDVPAFETVTLINSTVVNISGTEGQILIEIDSTNLTLSYEWFNESGNLVATTRDLLNITEAPQNYRLVITDSNGCQYEYVFFVDLENKVVDLFNIRDYVNIFPNPVSELLTVQFLEEIAGQAMIYDLTGKQIIKDSQLMKNHKFKVLDLESGVYLLRLEFENGPKIAYFVKE